MGPHGRVLQAWAGLGDHMRASRLLRMLLLLQNRGRMTSAQLAQELEVVPRTILRDVDALTEAGLPIIVTQGNQGGIELGFRYRTRLTGLASDEAEAMAVILTRPMPELDALGLGAAGARARSKMLESFPDGVRAAIEQARGWYRFADAPGADPDPRVAALALAIKRHRIVRIRAGTPRQRVVHPIALWLADGAWHVTDRLAAAVPIALDDCDDINISARTFPA